MIPLFMRLYIVEDNRKKINLLLPLFLIWIILFCFMLLLLPFVLIAALILWILGYNLRILSLFPKLFSVICALSGLRIQVEEQNKRIYILVQ